MYKLLICIIAGLGAGLGTGFAGMSAAAVISPMLITFLHMDSYLAVGIALASDVLASAVSAYTYGKNKNLDIKNGIIMMVSVLCLTMVGSFVANMVPKTTMGSFSTVMTLFLGIKFIVKPVVEPKARFKNATAKQKAMYGIISIFIGTKCISAILEGMSFSKAAFIISPKSEEIAHAIMTKLNRGVTALDGMGMYTEHKTEVMLCVFAQKEITRVKEIVSEIDKNAFVLVTDVKEVLGKGFAELIP